MTCANCSEDALYIYSGSGLRTTYFCYGCLPAFLRPLAKAGVLPTTPLFDEIKTRMLVRLQPEELAPVKRTRRKK